MAKASLIRRREVGEAGLEAEEVEVVLDKIDIEFTEELVVLEVTEPGNPAALSVIRLLCL
jgi:hypothetical protein